MTNHTADDFAKARFADKGLFRASRCSGPEADFPWISTSGISYSDEGMAAEGWSPVREADDGVTLHTVKVAQPNAEKKRQKLLDHIASLEAIIRRRNDRIERLEFALDEAAGRIEKVRAARDEAVPLSLDALRTAWENAEQADECRKGDVLIQADDFGGYTVYPAAGDGPLIRTRVLSRAPQREPHENLADAIREVWPSAYDEIDIGSLAYALHEHGVRVTGGEA